MRGLLLVSTIIALVIELILPPGHRAVIDASSQHDGRYHATASPEVVNMMRSIRSMVLLIGLVCLGACHSPLGLQPAPVQEHFVTTHRSALTSHQLSDQTERTLITVGLPPRATFEAASALSDSIAEDPDAMTFLALAEVAFMIGRNQAVDTETRRAQLAVASLASWIVLFDPEFELSPYGSEWPIARGLHNASVASLIEILEHMPRHVGEKQTVYAMGQEMEVDVSWRASPWTAEAFSKFLPAMKYRVRGVRHRHWQHGIGAALLADRGDAHTVETTAEEHYLPPNHQAVAISAIVHDVTHESGTAWPPHRFSLTFYDPVQTPFVSVAGRCIPLEADFTAPLVHTLARDRTLQQAGRGGLIDTERWEDISGLYMLEPFDPDRVPVVFIHGLRSSPMIWREMVNDLMGDPEIRAQYQFWFYLYPTGTPFAYTAKNLRQALRQLRAMYDPDHTVSTLDEMVLVGHSMGGLVARLLVTESDDALWNAISDVCFEEAVMKDEDRSLIRNIFFFDPVPEVRRVVFIATPHRGSVVADRAPGRLVARFVQLPSSIVGAAKAVIEANPGRIRPFVDPRRPVATSIDSLSPRSSFLSALAELPISDRVTVHSIIGCRSHDGRPGGTDGVVPYDSAHLPGADSELLIPRCGHSVPLHSAAAMELLRILHEHR
ncbi:MAG: alpha/beta hydrolase [Phycisphaerales bacterium]|nr:MAG: alpha/beta hydrolase [Phycisphaerales bacterium]